MTWTVGHLSIGPIGVGGPGLTTLTVANTFASASLNDARRFFLDGNYLYVLCGGSTNHIAIVNVSSPTSPSIAATFTHANMTAPTAFTKVGNHLYVTNTSTNALIVINVSSPGSPSHAATLTDATNLTSISGVGGLGNTLYFTGSARFGSIDISTPSSPSFLHRVTNANFGIAPETIEVSGTVAYAMGRSSNDVSSFNVSNPSLLVHLHTFADNPILNALSDLDVAGSYIYVSNSAANGALYVLNVANPLTKAASVQTSNTFWATGIQTVSTYVFMSHGITDSVSVWDVTDPTVPAVIDTITDATNLDFPNDIAVTPSAGHIFVCTAQASGKLTTLTFT